MTTFQAFEELKQSFNQGRLALVSLSELSHEASKNSPFKTIKEMFWFHSKNFPRKEKKRFRKYVVPKIIKAIIS